MYYYIIFFNIYIKKFEDYRNIIFEEIVFALKIISNHGTFTPFLI